VSDGVVYLVGAGPGDPDLLTMRALWCIRTQADLVIADRLVDSAVLALCNRSAEVVVRPPGRSGLDQEEINRRLIEGARAGKNVVRLKGGDPFVFGRGGEEAEALAKAGIRFEVIPGVTAAIAAPAYAGIPLTHRGAAGAVAFVTGHEADDKEGGQVDYAAIARGAATLVFYMSLHKIGDVMRRLVEAGRAPDEPVAIIERGTTPRQRVFVTTLSAAAEVAARERVEPPALAVVGEVVRAREHIAWFERRPLLGRRLLVLSSREAPLVRLRSDGAELVPISPLTVVPRPAALREALSRVATTRLLIFTSAHAVDAFFSALKQAGHDARVLAHCKVAVVGAATRDRLAERGIEADLTGEGGGAELAAAIHSAGLPGPALHPAAADVRPELAAALSAEMAIETVPAYDTVPAEDALAAAVRAHRLRPFDAIALASPRGARAFLEVLGGPEAISRCLVGAIGATTAEALRELGLHPLVASRPDLTVLCDELCAALAARSKIE
jgi:uroporphyrinogen III methyltransferase/synthase